MKTKKYCLILAAVAAILCIPAPGQIEPETESFLIGQANPALTGIENLHLTIIHPDKGPDGLVWEKLKEQIKNKLTKAGIEVFTPEPGVMYKLPLWPELQIRVDMLELKQSRQYVFHIQTLLAKIIQVQAKPVLRQKADVWKTGPVMQAASVQDTPAAVTNAVLQQTDTFITAYFDANPKGARTDAGSNQLGISQKEPTKPSAESQAAKYKYVASKNSKVFHKPDCTWVKRIAAKNLVHYKTREDAVNDGKRPCKTCKP